MIDLTDGTAVQASLKDGAVVVKLELAGGGVRALRVTRK